MHRALVALLPLVVLACSSAAPEDPPGGSASGSADPTVPTMPGGNATGAAGSAACAPDGKPVFANAVCVCEDYGVAGALVTVGTAGAPANVGVNGHSASAAGTHIGGSFVSYTGAEITGPVEIDDDLASTGDVHGAGVFKVGKDLIVGGKLDFAGVLTVGGALRSPNASLVAGSLVSSLGPYAAPALPCGCADGQVIDVAAAVADAKAKNDNAANGFSADGLDLIGPTTLTLKKGDYYIREITKLGLGQLKIDGNVRIYVDGSIDQGGVHDIELLPGATLDVFVKGRVATAGAVKYGDASKPDAFRLYVGGDGSMMVTAGAQEYYGLIYAPRAHVAFTGVTEIHGALFAKDLAWSGVIKVDYAGGGGATTSDCTPSKPSETVVH